VWEIQNNSSSPLARASYETYGEFGYRVFWGVERRARAKLSGTANVAKEVRGRRMTAGAKRCQLWCIKRPSETRRSRCVAKRWIDRAQTNVDVAVRRRAVPNWSTQPFVDARGSVPTNVSRFGVVCWRVSRAMSY
jgi:hypothetical protein